MTLVEYVHQLIKQNKLKTALEALEKWAEGNDSDLHNTIIIQMARWNSLKRDERMGIMSKDEFQRNVNRIRYAVLSILEDVPTEITVEVPPAQEVKKQQGNPKNSGMLETTRKLFISYAREDYEYVKELEKQLKALQYSGHIASWSDSHITAGQEWNDEIKFQIDAADIILLMVSADFIGSDFINKYELPWAEENRQRNGALIVPVIVRPCFWKNASYARYGALPKDARNELKPISEWSSRDSANLSIVQELMRIIDQQG